MRRRAAATLWEVPAAVWLYGFLRAGALGLPVVTGAGGVGVGFVVVPPLFYMMARGSSGAWGLLLVFDSLSFAVLVATRAITGAAPLHVGLSAAALALLLVPSIRRWVAPAEGRRQPTDTDRRSKPSS